MESHPEGRLKDKQTDTANLANRQRDAARCMLFFRRKPIRNFAVLFYMNCKIKEKLFVYIGSL